MSDVVAYRFRRSESDDWHFDTVEGLPYEDRVTLIEAGWIVEPLTLAHVDQGELDLEAA